MKNAFKTASIFLIALSTFSACKKKTEPAIDFTIDDKNLTGCLQGNCSFEYTNYAAIADGQLTLKTGAYRIFSANSVSNFSTTKVSIEAPMEGDKFSLNDADIKGGKVKHFFSCASCDYFILVPVGGTVKGIRVAKNNSMSERWLLDARIAVAAEKSTTVVDTIRIKQYFNLAVK